ncbi:ABC transporter permease [Prosthecomicrobium pneumaticum]|uniref:Simple sugar transport system permease protein n=1 Tax=Prosthecomicrobium pneumaticum TaxID=81895 RepID=A0A7W9L3Q6_9HYPH|nr:ABC transporter permease [Prosthecomicrobium pneumaticum]MBB5754794.1 simple sugar transport system permease protein [Prosthecomicrobium pneumaticum]
MSYRLQRLPSAHPGIAVLARLVAIVLALVIAGIALAFTGARPLALGVQVISSTFGSSFGLEDLGLLVTPLIFTGLAVALTQRIGIWNIGAEGQFYLGAFFATWLGTSIAGAPLPLMLVALFLAGALGGALWILIPTLARAYADVNELITTLLLNFVATLLVYYVSTGPWRDAKSNMLASTARIRYEVPEFWGIVHWGFPVAVLMALGVAALLAYTRWGYEVRIAGANPQAARYAGMPVRRRIIVVMLLSGAIAGVAGMFEVAGTVHRLQGGISNNFGYLGIMVAVLARGSALAVIPAAAMMAVILNAGIILQTQGITTSTVLAITGLVLFFTAIGDEAAHYRLVRTGAQPA